MLDRPITSSVIPIRHVPSAPPVYTLPRHASTSRLDEKQRPASPKKNRRFSLMPGKKDTSQPFSRTPLRHSLRELSSHKKQQSGSLPDFTLFAPGKNKKTHFNKANFNNSNNVNNKTNLSTVTRLPVPSQCHKLDSNDNDSIKDEGGDDDDLTCTQSESLLTTSSGGDDNLEQPIVQLRSSSGNNLRMTDIKQQEKQKLHDSDEGLDHKHFIVRGLCFGSYPLFHKGGTK